MVSTKELVSSYKTTPFDFYTLSKEKAQFEIVEDMPETKKVREGHKVIKINGIDKTIEVFLIRIKVGLFEKDLSLGKYELQKLALMVPENEQKNLKGSVFGFNGMELTYITTSHESNNTNSPAQPPVQPTDQKDAFVNKLVESIKAINMIGTDVFASDVMKMADKISPGNAVQIVGLAKQKGLISEVEGGVYRVN